MKKKLFILAVVSLMVCLIGFVAIASACDHDKRCKSTQGKKEGVLCLYQKEFLTGPPEWPFGPGSCLDDQNWDDNKDDGAWGKLKYNLSGKTFNFDFEGHGLVPEENYTLIYFIDVYVGGCFPGLDGTAFMYLGSDVADKHGHVNINGSLATGDLPDPTFDFNSSANNVGIYNGAKIWLVLSADIYMVRPQFFGWNPTKYLFEEKGHLITYDAQ